MNKEIVVALIALVGAVLGGGVITHLLNNKPPIASIRAIRPAEAGEGYVKIENSQIGAEFNAGSSQDPEGGSALSHYSWELRLGGEVIDEKSGKSEIGYTTPSDLDDGFYTLTLTVKDNRGKPGTQIYRLEVESSEVGPDSPDKVVVQTEDWWIPWDDESGIPRNALVVDYEIEDSQRAEPIFLCRAFDEGILKPGKVLESGKCFVPRYTIEDGVVNPDRDTRPAIAVSTYEVFEPEEGLSRKWLRYQDVKNDSHSVYTDSEQKSSSIVCRTKFGQETAEGNMRSAKHPGIVNAQIRQCIFPWDKVSGYLDEFELLVISGG